MPLIDCECAFFFFAISDLFPVLPGSYHPFGNRVKVAHFSNRAKWLWFDVERKSDAKSRKIKFRSTANSKLDCWKSIILQPQPDTTGNRNLLNEAHIMIATKFKNLLNQNTCGISADEQRSREPDVMRLKFMVSALKLSNLKERLFYCCWLSIKIQFSIRTRKKVCSLGNLIKSHDNIQH